MNNAQQTTLVLLPGLDGTGKLFQPFLDALPGGVRTYVVAYPPGSLWSVSEYARYVANQLPQGRIVLLAESFSGMVALALLASRFRRIDAVVFCAAFAEPPRPWLLRLVRLIPGAGVFAHAAPGSLLRRFCVGPQADATQIALLRTAVSAVSPALLSHRLGMVATERARVSGRFDTPCYYLQATHDRLVPADAAHWFARYFEHFRVEQVEGPHFVLQVREWECARRVMSIFNEVANGKIGYMDDHDAGSPTTATCPPVPGADLSLERRVVPTRRAELWRTSVGRCPSEYHPVSKGVLPFSAATR